MHTRIKKHFVNLLVLILPLLILGQESWDFGNYQKAFITTSSPPLKIKMIAGASLSSSRFVTRVGGVSFNGTAQPDNAIENVKIDYEYVYANPDGQRLKLTVGDQVIYPYLPDWQLIPIINYSNSEYNSCVSLFGPETDESAFDIVYHPSFQNTLLGVRLLQADMALMDLETHWQLPKLGSRIVYGRGETKENSTWYSSASQIQNYLSLDDYQSWVLTDDEIAIVFDIENNELVFSGYPYYHFWKINSSETELLELRYQSDVAQYKAEFNSYQELIVKYDGLVELHNSGNGNYEYEIDQLKNKILAKEATLSRLENEIERLVDSIENHDYEVNNVSAVTNGLKYKYNLYLKYNPSLYTTIKNVAHFAALFRYLKKENPLKWSAFYRECSSMEIYPDVKTPTKLPK